MTVKQVPKRPAVQQGEAVHVNIPEALLATGEPKKRRCLMVPADAVEAAVGQVTALGAGLRVTEAAGDKDVVRVVDPNALVVTRWIVRVLPNAKVVAERCGVDPVRHSAVADKWEGMVDLHLTAKQVGQEVADSREVVARVVRSERARIDQVMEAVLKAGSGIKEEVRLKLKADWDVVVEAQQKLAAKKKAKAAATQKETQQALAERERVAKQNAVLETMINLRRQGHAAAEPAPGAAEIDEAARTYDAAAGDAAGLAAAGEDAGRRLRR